MSGEWFQFGERHPEYPVRVLNERVVRAGAGIFFVFALVSMMNAWLVGNFFPLRLFIPAFLADFTIRIFINPRFAPSLILGQWLVRKQQPEYAGAAQKRFAWAIGFVLASIMFYRVDIQGAVGPLNLLVCGLCSLLMWLETACGICVGCWIYNRFSREPARLCPGGVCAESPPAGQAPTPGQGLWVLVFLAALVAIAFPLWTGPLSGPAPAASSPERADAERCRVPEFARAMGHGEAWKRHHACP